MYPPVVVETQTTTTQGTGQSLPACEQSASSASCTIAAVLTPDVPFRTLTVRLLGETLATGTTPPVNVPDTTSQHLVVTVAQSVGPVLGSLVSECEAGFSVNLNSGQAMIAVTLNDTTLLTTTMNVPAFGEVLRVDVC